jgi:hypothetical protein
MIDRTGRDQRLLRRLLEAGAGPGPALAAAERERAALLRDAISAALLADACRRAADAAGGVPEGLPPHRDWSWRPVLWRAPLIPSRWDACAAETALSPDATLFYDCPLGEIGARQVRAEGPPFAVVVEAYTFRGSYLSLAVDLPPEALSGLRRRHVIRLDLRIRSERPATAYARLNLLRGTAPATIVREVPQGPQGAAFVDFDLAGLKADITRSERLWIDLIFDGVAQNAITVEELFLSRTPRAEV